ncbi:MAG: chromosomal replication initiator protein DnaA [Clostridia bacterium]|nr:chromosomal replication initiator protein DnaA [Clostridia bacterium]
MNNIVEIWKQVLEIIKPEIPIQVSFTTWIETIIPIDFNNYEFIIKVPYSYNKEMIEQRYADLIKNAIKFVTGSDVELKILINSDHTEIEDKYRFKQTNLNPSYTFDSFVIGKSNQLAHATSLALAEGRTEGCNPLFLYGGVGLGKTHLMHAIGNYVLKYDMNKNILYVSSEQFTNEYINSLKTNTNERFREKYRTVDILMIDDIQFISDKEATQEEFFHTFNELYLNDKIIIITADRHPKDLPTFMERLKTRFAQGISVDINPPDYETRVAILKKKAFQYSMEIPEDVYDYIAKNIKSNIRELEGAVKKLMIQHKLMKKEITVTLAKESLTDMINEKKQKITPELIKDNVEKYFSLREDDLFKDTRSQNIVYPRQVAMYLIKNYTNLSLKQIGEFFGGKDHSTVISGINKIESKLNSDPSLEKTIEDLLKDIKN